MALKYGITLANLRRANQLWTSDSIHRRSVLYIPIESASRAQEYIPGPKHTPAATPGASEEVTNVFDVAYSSPSSFDGDKSDDGFTINVVRVPAKQLTYFPPSSTKNLDSTPSRHSLDNPSESPASSTRISPSSSGRYDPSPLNNSLTSILTALPIAASTRDELLTRLSLDSVSSSYSDTSRRNSSEVGHELDEVHKPSRGRRGRPRVSLSNYPDADDISSPTPKARPQNNSLPPSPRLASVRVPGYLPKSSDVHSISSCSPPQFYISQLHETFVRTSQLEPSPAMEIPLRRSNTLGAASDRKLQAAFGTERQSRTSKERRVVKDNDLHSLVRRMKLQDYET